MESETHKNLNLQLNWRFRFFVFLGTFLFSFLGFRYLFDSELDFSLFMSLSLAIFQSLSLFAGLDIYSVRKQFKDYTFQSSAYIKVNAFFYCPGRLIIVDDNIVFITHKLNARNPQLELKLDDIFSLKRTKILGVINRGLSIKTKDGHHLKFSVSNINELYNELETIQ